MVPMLHPDQERSEKRDIDMALAAYVPNQRQLGQRAMFGGSPIHRI